MSLPVGIIEKALDLISKVLESKKKKVTLHQLQQLCGFLNFLAKAVVPGRTFMRRLYSNLAIQKDLGHRKYEALCTGEQSLYM